MFFKKHGHLSFREKYKSNTVVALTGFENVNIRFKPRLIVGEVAEFVDELLKNDPNMRKCDII